MARVIWTEPALHDLEAIADYIALDKPGAAARYVRKVFSEVERLGRFPKSGSIPPELPRFPYRQIVIPPCRTFHRIAGDQVFIIFVMRSEQRFRMEKLEEREDA